mmetsp:Transcript_27310/g.38632  ORF Transcript_27310/g.38632 Transcript_27310/m.38632 type:complete len:150 (-) Transcript_27310:94-543(-)
MSKKVVAVSGFFDPLHYGHIQMLQKAKDLGDTLIVLVNSDAQAAQKKGKAFMPCAERVKLVRSIDCVTAAVEVMDKDHSCAATIAALHPDIFAIGLDEPDDAYFREEKEACKKLGIQVICPLGERTQSSSFLIEQAARVAKEKEEKEGK